MTINQHILIALIALVVLIITFVTRIDPVFSLISGFVLGYNIGSAITKKLKQL